MILKLLAVSLLASASADVTDSEDNLPLLDGFDIQASDPEGVDVGAFFSRFGLGRDLKDDEDDPLVTLLENSLSGSGPPNFARILSLASSFDTNELHGIMETFQKRKENNPDDRIANLILKFGRPMVERPDILKVLSAGVVEVDKNADTGETVEVNLGKNSGYRGLKKTTHEGFEYNAFVGVRYADPPTEEYRFQPPRIATPPKGIEDALIEKPPCPQYNLFNSSEIIGDEDCLFLNIFTPKLPINSTSDGLPVMIYIHGGGHATGGASIYQPDYLVEKNVVLVVIQYRLGSFGFLSNEDEDITGNYALYDQIMAFDWVKRNIERFGGNPNDVTLFGQSAGASFIHFHLVSPLSRGLFHAAITQSGTALDHWALQRDGKNITANLVKKVGCDGKATTVEMAKCLQAVPAEKLVEADRNIRDEYAARGNFQLYGPVIQKPFDDRFLPPFLSEEPSLSLRLGRTAKVPLIMGLTKDETVGYIGKYILARSNNSHVLGRTLVTELLRNQFANIPDLLVDMLDHEFFEGKLAKGGVQLDTLLDASNDFTFRSAAFQTAAMYSKLAPVYFFSYEYHADVSLSRVLNVFGLSDSYLGGTPKVEHGDDLPMIFPMRAGGQEVRVASENDIRIRDLITTAWTNFVHFKAPLTSDVTATSNVSWLPFTEETPRYLRFASPSTLIDSYRPRQMRFLLEVMPKLALAAQVCSLPLGLPDSAPKVTVDSVIVETKPNLDEIKTAAEAVEKQLPIVLSTTAVPETENEQTFSTGTGETTYEEYVYDYTETEATTEEATSLPKNEPQQDAALAEKHSFESKSSQAQAETKPVLNTSNLKNSLDHIDTAKFNTQSVPIDMYRLMSQEQSATQPSLPSFDIASLSAVLPIATAPAEKVADDDIAVVLSQLPPHFQALARSLSPDGLKSAYASLKSSGQLGDLISAYG